MSTKLTVVRPFHVRRGARGRRGLQSGESKQTGENGRIPRVSRLMALAIRFDQLIRDGVVKDQAELARLGHVSRARLTQVMNLLNLATGIQQQILFLPRSERGRDCVTERDLRPVAAIPDWQEQRSVWGARAHQCRNDLVG